MEHILPVSYAIVFVWGIAVLVGLIGLGRVVAAAVGGTEAGQAGWGLHAVWGMALFLFAGGFLAVFGVCGEAAITALLGLGVAAALWTAWRRGRPTRASLGALPWKSWPVFAVLAIVYSGGLCWQRNVNFVDDLPAYYEFCEKLLATGSFDEPFSWRRLASLGGQTLLQCSVLAHGSWAHAQAFETALCPVMVVGLVFAFRRGMLARSPLGLFLALLAVTTPIIRANSASHFTGILLFTGLFVTLDLAEHTDTHRWRLLIASGVVAAAMCSLRAQYIPAAVGTLGLFSLATWLKDRSASRWILAGAGSWSCGLVVGLLPWMIMGYRSNGSPLFPLFQGGNNPAYMAPSLHNPMLVQLAEPMHMLLHPALLPLVLCLLAVPAWRQGVAARSVAVAALMAALALAYCIPFAPDEVTIPRYVQPLLVGGALAALMAAAVAPRGRLTAWVLAALVMTTSLPDRTESLSNYYAQLSITRSLKMPFHGAEIASYLKVQALVPEGRRILVCSDYPFLFDQRRNPICIIDLPHATSPSPGLPFGQLPEETKRYLRAHGIEYLIYSDFNEAGWLYNRPLREKELGGEIVMLRTQAPFLLDFFSTVENLAASETHLGRAGALSAIQFKP